MSSNSNKHEDAVPLTNSVDDAIDDELFDDEAPIEDDEVVDELDDLLEIEDDTIAEATSPHVDAFGYYMSNALKYKLLTKEQEIDYATRAQAGEKAAFDAMLMANLRLVVKISRRYAHSKISIEDLISEGNMGLMKAIERFDPERGFRFSTYATWWIRQSVTRAISNQARLVRWPVHVAQLEYRYRLLLKKWEKEKRVYTDEDVAKELELSLEQLANLKMLNDGETSLHDTIPGEEGDDRMKIDLVFSHNDDVDESDTAYARERGQVKVVMARVLTKRESDVIAMRFGLATHTMTLEDIANLYGLTRERIRQIESKALIKLRRYFKMEGLKGADFLTKMMHS